MQYTDDASLCTASEHLTGMYHINHERQKSIISINNEKSDTKIAHDWEVKGNMQT